MSRQVECLPIDNIPSQKHTLIRFSKCHNVGPNQFENNGDLIQIFGDLTKPSISL